MARYGIAAILVIGCFGAVAANAALPPKFQRMREFEAILAAGEVTKAFPESEIITAVEYVRPDRYLVRSDKCRLEVALVDLPMPDGMVGPRRFAVKPGRIVCLAKPR